MSKINTNPVTWESGSDNMGGYKNYVLVIPTDWVTKAPVIPKWADITDDEQSVTATGSFVFKEGKKPKFVKCTDKTVSYNGENQGEIEGRSFAPSGEFFRAGNKKDAAALARLINNTDCYLVIEDMDGNQLLIGQPDLPANIASAFEGGMNREDRRGYRFTFSHDSLAPVIFLETPINVDELRNPTI